MNELNIHAESEEYDLLEAAFKRAGITYTREFDGMMRRSPNAKPSEHLKLGATLGGYIVIANIILAIANSCQKTVYIRIGGAETELKAQNYTDQEITNILEKASDVVIRTRK